MDGLDPKNWTNEFFPAPPFPREAFQAELDRICGKARGQSKVRLVFGSEEEELADAQISTLGVGLGRHKVGRYTTNRDGRKVRIRRWIFEEWQPPEQLHEGFVRMPGSGLYIPPNERQKLHKGVWNLIYTVADHSRCNCAPEDYSCFGAYRPPGPQDLKNFMRMTAAMQEDQIKADPFSPLSQEMISKLQRKANAELEAYEKQIEREEEEYYEDRRKTRRRHSVSG